MKKLFIATAFMACITLSAQSKKDIARHAGAPETTKDFMKKSEIKDHQKGFIMYKLYGLDKVIELTPDEMKSLYTLFESQYQPLQDAYAKFKESGSIGAKTELIKLIVANEEAFRKALPKEKLAAYLQYADKTVQSIPFADNYLSDYELERYKKNLL